MAALDHRLLQDWQRNLPLVPRPFAEMAAVLGVEEAEVLARLVALRDRGAIARVGATVRPNTAGASTLAALAVPEARLAAVAAIVGAEPGVNHSYLREHDWNLWFVATGPDQPHLQETLARIAARTGLQVLDLPLVRAFNLDLGFALDGSRRGAVRMVEPDLSVLRPDDAPILQGMSAGLDLVARPFAALASVVGKSEAEVLARVRVLAAAGILSRVGVIVRHRALGWRANAMVVWKLPLAQIDVAGPALARHPGVTLCYQRRLVPGVWEHPLFCMIHARSREEALAALAEAAALPELAGAQHQVLFSQHCFKQTGALLHDISGVAAE